MTCYRIPLIAVRDKEISKLMQMMSVCLVFVPRFEVQYYTASV